MLILECDLLCQIVYQIVDLHALLLHGITITNGDAAILLGLKVNRDAVRGTDLILTAVTLTDGTSIGKVSIELI